ncbi:MAG: hypothetical protein LBL34_00715 [Clostridiales bacterium]|jgi:hypothetical protein|nr:hypothetical protein [Clostridiales bacterium]
MNDNNKLQLFEGKEIRSVWDASQEEWYFSIVDVCEILTEQPTHDLARNYWKVLKHRLIEEGNEPVTICNRLKMKAYDGKMRFTDVAKIDGILRIIQSIPSKKAEPFKMWLAEAGKERIDETIDPELAIDRALSTYLKKGYSPAWINQRLQAVQVRKDLTDEWDKGGVAKGKEYAILTDEITRNWSGMTTRQYKDHKGLKKENLRDNMSMLELTINQLAEATTTAISKEEKPENFDENLDIAKRGGKVAGIARREVERETGKPVITKMNALDFAKLLTDVIAKGTDNND